MAELPRTGNFFVQLGEQEGIGASQGFLSYSNTGIILDAGVGFKKIQGHPIQQVHVPTDIAGHNVDLIICSHQHLDHAGRLPKTVATYGDATVIMTHQCFQVLKVMLPDALKISGEETNKANALGYEPPIVPFTEEELKDFFALEGTPRLRLIDAPCELENLPNLEGWKFKFHPAGHIVGAISTFITAPDGMTFYETADVASQDQENVCHGVLHPKGWERPDVMVTEATYGGTPMTENRSETWKKIEQRVTATLRHGGTVLFPTFAVGRLSVLVNMLTEMGSRLGFVTVADGLAVKGKEGEAILDIELGLEKVKELERQGLLILIDQSDAKGIGIPQRESILFSGRPFVVVSSSATMENGWSSWWAKHILPKRNNAVILTGYVFPDSIAEQVLRKGGNIVLERYSFKWNKIIKRPVNVACEVYSFSLSAHDYQQGLVQRVVVARPKLLVVHHTSDESFTAYVEALKAEFNRLGLQLPRIVRAGHQVVIELK